MNFFELNQQMADGTDKGEFLQLMSKLSRRLGEKSNTYAPLVRFVSRNPQMLSLLSQLVEEVGMAQKSTVKPILNQ